MSASISFQGMQLMTSAGTHSHTELQADENEHTRSNVRQPCEQVEEGWGCLAVLYHGSMCASLSTWRGGQDACFHKFSSILPGPSKENEQTAAWNYYMKM